MKKIFQICFFSFVLLSFFCSFFFLFGIVSNLIMRFSVENYSVTLDVARFFIISMIAYLMALYLGNFFHIAMSQRQYYLLHEKNKKQAYTLFSLIFIMITILQYESFFT